MSVKFDKILGKLRENDAGSETDPVVGAVSGLVKADGAGNISAAAPDTDYLEDAPSDGTTYGRKDGGWVSAGVATGDDTAYGAGWDGSTNAPTQNAVYDKIQSLPGGHDAVTLDANADTLLSLSTQEIGLDVQGTNKVLVGPVSGASAVPTFRDLDEADIPTSLPNLSITESQISDLGTYLTAETDPVFLASEAANFVAGDKTKLDGIAAGAEVNVQADWNAVSGDAQILNKPDLSGLTYKGVLDASGGTYPGSPTAGDYYIISVAGTISGTAYAVSDWATYNGSSWDKIDNQTTTVTASDGLEKIGNDIQIADLGVTAVKLAGSIPDSKLSTISTADKVSWTAVNKTGSSIDDLADVVVGTPTDDQALAWDSATSKFIPQTISGGGGAGNINYTKNLIADTSEVTVANTAVSTKIFEYTVPGGTLSTNRILRTTVTGTYVNNSGSSKTLTVYFYYGGVGASYLVGGAVTGTITTGAGTGSFTAECVLAANGATNAQTGRIVLTVRGGVGTPIIVGSSSIQLAIDSTVNKVFYVYAKHSAAHANTTLTGQLMNIELVNATDNLMGATGETGATGPAGADGADGQIQTIVAGSNITVDDTDPANPIISSTASGGASSLTDLDGGTAGANAYDFGGATSLEIPNSATPSLDAAGEIAIDTDTYDLKTYDGSAAIVLSSKTKFLSFVIFKPTGGKTYPFIQMKRACTITAVSAICSGGTNVVGQLQEYTGAAASPADVDSADWTITTSEYTDTSFTNASIDAGDWLGFTVTTVSGAVEVLSVTVEFTEA